MTAVETDRNQLRRQDRLRLRQGNDDDLGRRIDPRLRRRIECGGVVIVVTDRGRLPGRRSVRGRGAAMSGTRSRR